jgi:hypothetical protein
MTAGTLAFLVGLYVFPFGLLWWGHRVRRLSPRARGAFWGAVTGHCIAGLFALGAGVFFPESWTEAETLRGFFGLWAIFVFPVAGGFAGAFLRPASS